MCPILILFFEDLITGNLNIKKDKKIGHSTQKYDRYNSENETKKDGSWIENLHFTM